MSILSVITAHKRKEVALSKKKVSLESLARKASLLPRRPGRFARALRGAKGVAVIAEIKRRSPSKGLIRKDFNPARIAKQYQKGGASALSVLTDKKFFGGDPAFIAKVKKSTSLPVLRKDFILDGYQVYESKVLGADAILLIAASLNASRMASLASLASRLGLDVLFEVHNAAELRKVLPLKPRLVGVNNRDLRSFKVDLGVSRRLGRSIPKNALFVSESGIFTDKDVARLHSYGARAVLVGESLMRQKDPGQALKRLLGKNRGKG